jgi:hypothetical protein
MTKTSTPTGAQTYSLYKNVTSASPKQISLAEIFQLITGDATLDAKTRSYRRLLEVGSPAAAQAKRDMPAFGMGGEQIIAPSADAETVRLRREAAKG